MPPKFKRNIQCILLKKQEQISNHTYLRDYHPLRCNAIPSKLQLNKRRLKSSSKTPHLHIPPSTGFSLSYIVFARRY